MAIPARTSRAHDPDRQDPANRGGPGSGSTWKVASRRTGRRTNSWRCPYRAFPTCQQEIARTDEVTWTAHKKTGPAGPVSLILEVRALRADRIVVAVDRDNDRADDGSERQDREDPRRTTHLAAFFGRSGGALRSSLSDSRGRYKRKSCGGGSKVADLHIHSPRRLDLFNLVPAP